MERHGNVGNERRLFKAQGKAFICVSACWIIYNIYNWLDSSFDSGKISKSGCSVNGSTFG